MRRDLHSRVSLRRPVSISTVIQQGELKKRTAGWTLVAIGSSRSGVSQGEEFNVGGSRRIDWLDPPPLEGLA